VAKQFQHADKGIPFAVLVGEQELVSMHFSLKNLEWRTVSVDFEVSKKALLYSYLKALKNFVY
jgi:histidyl-tRNA synthetase